MGDQPVSIHVLPNGIRIVYQQRAGLNISHCGLIIDAGSRDELKKEHGLAHFIEHAMFKGTVKRKTFHILNRLDSVGGEVNAYTTKEDTSIYASFMSEHTERAIELLADITFRSNFPPKELEKEKDVIIDEIQSYMDSPSEMIFDDFEDLLFRGQALGRPILGTEDSVRRLGSDDILRFRAGRYNPEQMVFSYLGDLPFEKVKWLAEKHLADFTAEGRNRKRKRTAELGMDDSSKEVGTHQAHIIMGGAAYDVDHEKKYAMMLLNNLLGGPAMNSLLNLNVRERHGIAYNIESNYQAYTDAGLFQIYLGTEKKGVDKALRLVKKELKKLRDQRLGIRQLNAAKMQMRGYIALSREGGSSNMLALGKSLLLYDRVATIDEVLHAFDRIQADEVLAVANEILADDHLSTLIYH